MQNQLVKTEKRVHKEEAGPINRISSLMGKIAAIIDKSKDKTKDKEYLNADLFAQLVYMAAISSSGLSRATLVGTAAKLPYSSSSYFRDIDSLVHKLSYDYSEACNIIGERTIEPEPRAILLRMAATFTSGEDEHVFLKREAVAQGEIYGNAYERALQTLKNWTDAYVSLLLSASLIIIVSIISMMIYPVQDSFVLLLSFLAIIVTVAGAWIIYRAAPKEIKTHSLPELSRGQRLARYIFKTTMPFGLILCIILALTNVDLGIILIVGALLVLPPGVMIMWDDQKINKNDSDIAGVLRSLGGTAKALGTTISHAANKLDTRSCASLQGGIRRLKTRLLTGLNGDLCWEKFVSETGSEHVHRSVKILRDAVELGADPLVASEQASLYSMKINILRNKRELISSGFIWLCMVMHIVSCSLMLFITGVLRVFSEALTGIEELETEAVASLPTFGFFGDTTQLYLFNSLVMMIILTFTISNAFAIRAACGGHHYKFLFYLGILMVASGLSLIIMPHVVNMALGTMAPIS